MDYHPDKAHHVNPEVKSFLKGIWNGTPGDFTTKLYTTLHAAEERAQECHRKIAHINPDKAEMLNNPNIIELLSWIQGPGWVGMESLLEEQTDEWSYGKLCVDPRFLELVKIEEKTLRMPQEELNTARVLKYCISAYRRYGKKLYVVAPGLSWEMLNIKLRKMPSELLHLPFHALYLTAPAQLKVYNRFTGWHPLEGMYIVADNAVSPRTWRILLTAGPNEKSVHIKDDALFHFFIKLSDGQTIEECIENTLNDVDAAHDVSREIDGKTIHNSPMTDDQLDIFGMMREHLKKAFLYAVNVMLYATHPDAEQEAFNANPDFQKLWKRAHRAKGKKRKDLFARAKDAKGPTYIKLGGSVTVSRELRDAVESSKGKGTKHSVRTYVAAHWQHFWVGPRDGERKRIYKLKKSHWKGAKDLPVSETSRHVK